MPLHRRIAIGFAAGAALGLSLHAALGAPPPWLAAFLDHAAEPAGRLFLRLLLVMVLPLVVSSLILGVAEMGDAARLGRVALRTLGFALLVTTLSVATGLVFVKVFRPGAGFPAEVREGLVRSGRLPSLPPADAGTIGSRLVALIPDNPVKAAASGDFLGVMFFALLLGAGLAGADKRKTEPLLRVLEGVYEASMGLIALAMRLAPFGVGALILNLTARHGVELFRHLLGYAAVVLGALAFHQFVTYSLLLKAAGMSPRRFLAGAKDALLTAFATSSSSATLPVSLKAAEEGLGLPRDVSRFVMTVGASANQNGTALYEGVSALFLAQCFGVELGLAQQATVMVLAVLGGIGTAGVPGASLPMLMAILGSVGVPPEGVLLILGLDRFLDMARTALNVSGDLVIAVLVAGAETRR